MTMITGIGIFVGIVAGVIVQVGANWVMMRWQRRNAVDVLISEISLNLTEVKALRDRLDVLEKRVSAGQVNEHDLFVHMSKFDYSAMSPLIQAGYFHKLLGPNGAQDYFSVVRFFNVDSARFLTSKLIDEHQSNRSLNFLDWLKDEVGRKEQVLKEVSERL